MKVQISTVIKANENEMWEELQKVSSLMHVAVPILKFKPQKNQTLPEKWALGTKYKLKLFFLGIIPLGDHFIKVVEINQEKKIIVSNEHGNLTKVWNHIIKIVPIDDQNINYTDEIEIKAGLLTLSIWLFAHIFYRHRQNKWKKLLDR